jgi:hypothetical protein
LATYLPSLQTRDGSYHRTSTLVLGNLSQNRTGKKKKSAIGGNTISSNTIVTLAAEGTVHLSLEEAMDLEMVIPFNPFKVTKEPINPH